MRPLTFLPLASAVGLVLFACSGDGRDSGFGDGNQSSGAPGSSGGIFGENGNGEGGKPCVSNPGSYDIKGNNCDDDGDGKIDNPPSCDESLGAAGSAEEFARAIGICTKASEKGYGLVSAEFTSGANQQHGVLPKFGNVIKPREGQRLGVLSSGFASEYNGGANAPFGGQIPIGKKFQLNGKLPTGFPKPAAGCPIDNRVNDVMTVKLTLKAPANVSGIKFDFNFFSSEWPAYICSNFNDGFLAYLTSTAFNNGAGDNISFDKDKNPVSVNNGFFDRCTPNAQTGCMGAKPATSACPGGPAELAGTGFFAEGNYCGGKSVGGGATGWLTSQAPVAAGETFTLEFMVWDTGDQILDSSVLIDNFTWAEGVVSTSTERPPR